MGFTVDSSAVEALADKLDRYEQDASAIGRYIDSYLVGDTFGQIGAQGIMRYLTLNHEEIVSEARDRASTCGEVAGLAALGMNRAAAFYRDTDAAEAARLDATYPAATVNIGDTVSQPDTAMAFGDVVEPQAGLRGPDGGGYQPKGSSLNAAINGLADMASLAWWGRQILQEIYGVDPITELLEVLAGDWEAIGRYADAWRRCGVAYADMTRNMASTDEAVSEAWQGNAADAAMGWLQRFTDATTEEAAWCEYQEQLYKQHLEAAYWVYQQANYWAGRLLDAIAILAAIAITTPTGVGPLFVGVDGLVVQVLSLVELARQPYVAWKAMSANFGGPDGDAPASLMPSLRTNTDGPASYRHPSVAAR